MSRVTERTMDTCIGEVPLTYSIPEDASSASGRTRRAGLSAPPRIP
jgi:hypothetical protein